MSTPLAASVAAVIWAQHPSWTSAEVKSRLLDSSDTIDALSCNSSYMGQLGSGRINLYTATYLDSDGDGVHDWSDSCLNDPEKTEPGICGCGIPDTDTDGDGVYDCDDNCPDISNSDQTDSDNNGIGDACENMYSVPGLSELFIPLFLLLAVLGILSVRKSQVQPKNSLHSR
jgi:hypothetical protein